MAAALIGSFEQDPRLLFPAPGALGVVPQVFQFDLRPVFMNQRKRILHTPFTAMATFKSHLKPEFNDFSQGQCVHVRFGFNQFSHPGTLQEHSNSVKTKLQD